MHDMRQELKQKETLISDVMQSMVNLNEKQQSSQNKQKEILDKMDTLVEQVTQFIMDDQ